MNNRLDDFLVNVKKSISDSDINQLWFWSLIGISLLLLLIENIIVERELYNFWNFIVPLCFSIISITSVALFFSIRSFIKKEITGNQRFIVLLFNLVLILVFYLYTYSELEDSGYLDELNIFTALDLI